MAKIIISLVDKFLREVPLTKERMTIGRRPHNDIVLDDLAISGEHALIVTLKHDSYLEDLNSTNGTQVNGQPVRKHYLRHDDCIELAQYRIRYSADAVTATGSQTDACLGRARLEVLNGVKAGSETTLGKPITSVGKQDRNAAVILRKPDGYFLACVEDNQPPLLNGLQMGKHPLKLEDQDIIDIDGDQVRFLAH